MYWKLTQGFLHMASIVGLEPQTPGFHLKHLNYSAKHFTTTQLLKIKLSISNATIHLIRTQLQLLRSSAPILIVTSTKKAPCFVVHSLDRWPALLAPSSDYINIPAFSRRLKTPPQNTGHRSRNRKSPHWVAVAIRRLTHRQLDRRRQRRRFGTLWCHTSAASVAGPLIYIYTCYNIVCFGQYGDYIFYIYLFL